MGLIICFVVFWKDINKISEKISAIASVCTGFFLALGFFFKICQENDKKRIEEELRIRKEWKKCEKVISYCYMVKIYETSFWREIFINHNKTNLKTKIDNFIEKFLTDNKNFLESYTSKYSKETPKNKNGLIFNVKGFFLKENNNEKKFHFILYKELDEKIEIYNQSQMNNVINAINRKWQNQEKINIFDENIEYWYQAFKKRLSFLFKVHGLIKDAKQQIKQSKSNNLFFQNLNVWYRKKVIFNFRNDYFSYGYDGHLMMFNRFNKELSEWRIRYDSLKATQKKYFLLADAEIIKNDLIAIIKLTHETFEKLWPKKNFVNEKTKTITQKHIKDITEEEIKLLYEDVSEKSGNFFVYRDLIKSYLIMREKVNHFAFKSDDLQKESEKVKLILRCIMFLEFVVSKPDFTNEKRTQITHQCLKYFNIQNLDIFERILTEKI